MHVHLLRLPLAGVLVLIVTGGCEREPKRIAPALPLVVPVSLPIRRTVSDYAEYPGRTEAVQFVNVRARVTGYLVKMPFREGAEVKGPDDPRCLAASTLGLLGSHHPMGPLAAAGALHPLRSEGDLLFEIDPRPYQAQFDQAASEVVRSEAKYQLAKADNVRAKITAKTPGAMSQQDLDKYQANEDETRAAVAVARSALETYRLNLAFCRVTAPISGQVSRYFLTLGNLVDQNDTLLTTIASQDPIYVYFNMDEPTLERIKRAINEGQIQSNLQAADMPVFLGLQTGEGFPIAGTVNFVNNQVNPSTGTISVRGVFANPKSARGVRPLTPGTFVRVRLPLGAARPALLVADRAVGMDQGQRYLYVLDADNRVHYRRIRVGPLQDDGLRVIDDGLKPDDRVVISMLQRVRTNLVVDPELVPMPTTEPAAPAPAPPEAKR
ncbi:hypothetical protein AYO44_11950 [Planctomycetaceae bacterium SCGC AG-212-F19]|nr:hypothetical protein AYO44_11950 [Planctomycetaceae bacterium SCGC AG-212-F19]